MNNFYKIKIVLFFVGVGFLAGVSLAADGVSVVLTPREVCDRYENYLSLLKNIKFKNYTQSSLKAPNITVGPVLGQGSVVLTENSAKYEQIFTSNTQMDSDIVDQRLKQEILYGEKKGVVILKGGDKLVVNADFETFPKNFAERTDDLSEKIFFGFEFFGNKEISFLPHILKKAELSLKIDEKSQKWFLSANTNDSNFKIYFEDVNAGIPQQITFSKLVNKRKLYDVISIDFKISKFQTIAGVLLPTEMIVVREKLVPSQKEVYDPSALPKEDKKNYNSATVRRRIETTQVVWSDVSFVKREVSSGFKLEQFIKVPDGTEVHVRSAPQIEHVWMDGEIVPKTDEVALRIAQGDHKFMPSPSEPRFWVMGLGLVLILLSGLLEIRKRIRKKNKS